MVELYHQQIDACFAETIGSGGLPRKLFRTLLGETRPAVADLGQSLRHGSLPFLSLPARRDDLEALAPTAERLRDGIADLVVLGTGGSSLGAQALTALAADRCQPRLHFPDNLDGEAFAALLAGLEATKTGFLAVSKSGSTAETLAQTLLTIGWLRQHLDDGAITRHLLAIAEPTESPLRRLAARWGIEVLDHDPDICGRYSVLSLVGLLPAMAIGLDVEAVRAGAKAVLDEALRAPEAPPLVGAAIAVGLQRHHGITNNVMLAYGDRLERLVAWHRQIWGESLGKDGIGLTPIVALGPVDQHSQLQLWLAGPTDKSYTLIMAESRGRGPEIDVSLAGGDPALDYLAGQRVGDLVAAEAVATAETLAGRGRPTRVISFPQFDEATLGALFMHFILETIVAAHLLGVDPFTQPAVDEGKRLTRQYLLEDTPLEEKPLVDATLEHAP